MDKRIETYQMDRKFRERLARISRRRFMRSLGAGGLAAVAGTLYGCEKSTSQTPGDVATTKAPTDRCANTRMLFQGVNIDTVFGSTFLRLLSDAKTYGRVHADLVPYVSDVIDYLEPHLTLVDFFAARQDPTGGDLFKAFNRAEQYFAMPFRYVEDDQRAAAKELLEKDGLFRAAFGTKTFDYIHTTSLYSREELHALEIAHEVGLFRAYPMTLRPEDNDRCARTDAQGNWHCNTLSPGDKCNLVDGYPSGDSDICPGYWSKRIR